jgi:hypothetical protein
MHPDTLSCELHHQLVQKFKEAGFHNTFPEGGLPDQDGNIIPWSELVDAENGCEILKKRGMHGWVCRCPSHNQRFKITDKESGDPLPNAYYVIKSSSGAIVEGRTDDNGLTEKIHTKGEESLEIKVYQ